MEDRTTCIWREEGMWMIGTVTHNFRRVTTQYGERYVTNIELTSDKRDSIWITDIVKGGTKAGDFLESLNLVFRDGDEFNPLGLEIVGKKLLCMWGVKIVRGKVKEGIIRFKRLE